MSDVLLLALLVAAIAIGWWLGRRDGGRSRSRARGAGGALPKDYFVGLNYLLNEQPDRAIETFTQALEVNSDTVETHIALGNLYRSRGEADRAVRIHQNLLARPALTASQSGQVQLELSRDFLNLGLLDRAERLLLSLQKNATEEDQKIAARRLLVDLFEREKEWPQALEVAQPQLVRQDPDIRRAAAHWHCEIAQQQRAASSPSLARKSLRQALNVDGRCVRANWMLGQLEWDIGQYRDAARYWQRIPEQDPGFTAIVLEPLRDAYRLLDDDKSWWQFLEQLLQKHPQTTVVIMAADTLRRRQGAQMACAFVSEQLREHPSLRGIDYLMDLYLDDSDPDERDRLELLKQHTHQLLSVRPRHRCQRCGFGAEQLHWQCPRCRYWGTSKPVTGLEGE
ncbi:lipopolysaccharide assembly protein LapB [Salinicola rhizosphaerae]|uniref:Lipopolysaccharide assembly protein B n=1 Tax=Salinicola rhizosphaerae TaxID=1443141 RepID=A0ABQ3E663_9GAMM|nr:lipopolysaccharide assembly protein LapB [Salinicola rhizosphaerae]GHB27222.1 lipopolysaccharide assembly protein B [Salinicola rhizosphaerae]